MNIGVTGNFLSGKSSFAKMLSEETGFELFDSDAFVRSLYTKLKIKKIIVDNFGQSVYKGKELQKKVLSDLVFNSADNLLKLESIIHPYVEKEIRKKAGNPSKNTVFEIPLLYEKKLQELMDLCILVVCRPEICIKRAEKRGYSEKNYLERVSCQLDESHKRAMNPLVVTNEGGLNDLKQQVMRSASIINKIQGKVSKKGRF